MDRRGAWTADRHSLQLSTSTASVSIATLADADRTAIGDEAARYALQCVGTGTAGAGDYIIADQHDIEGVQRLSGKTVTVSFSAKATAGTPKVGLSLSPGVWIRRVAERQRDRDRLAEFHAVNGVDALHQHGHRSADLDRQNLRHHG